MDRFRQENGTDGLVIVKAGLECLDRGLYPSWDAQNPWSAALAEKLEYHFDHEYTAYEINVYGMALKND